MSSDLQDRLRDHAEAFDGLLSLIPANMYYQEEGMTQDQRRAKKQSKSEASTARRAKLDPDSDRNRNAKEIMEERSRRKRKADDAAETAVDESGEVVDETAQNEPPSKRAAIASARKESKKQKKSALKELRKTAQHGENSKKSNKSKDDQGSKDHDDSEVNTARTKQQEEDTTYVPASSEPKGVASTKREASHDQAADGSSGADAQETTGPTDKPANGNDDTGSDASAEKPRHITVPANTAALRARLAAKIEALRSARKADGTNGKPIRTRQELIEARRNKRKEQKLDLRRQAAKMAEERKKEEMLATSSTSSPVVASPSLDPADQDSYFAFGRVAFTDGSQLSHSLDYVLNRENAKKKGPSDPKTALLKLRNQQERLKSMDEEKRQDLEQKEAWLTARRRAEGDKIRDESTLKRAVKRKQQAKKKSSREWDDRIKAVEHGIKERQRRREENIQKRKDDKASKKVRRGKKKDGPTKSKTSSSSARKGRPGFEGSLGFAGKHKR